MKVKNILLFFICLNISLISANAQQTKRNLIANSNFEEGLKNWRIINVGGAYADMTIDEKNPVSGERSVKIVPYLTGSETYSSQLLYYFPVENQAKYKVSFKAKSSFSTTLFVEVCENHGSYLPLELTSYPNGFSNAANLRGTVTLGTEVKEYTFVTNGAQTADCNDLISFHFGKSSLSAVYWIDDIKICRADEGDWDGNLLPVGNFESVVPASWGEVSGFPMFKPESAWGDFYIDTSSKVISGSKSLWLKQKTNAQNFWGFSWLFTVLSNVDFQPEISFKAKSNQVATFTGSMASDPWDFPIAGNYPFLNFTVTPVVQTFILNKDLAEGRNKSTLKSVAAGEFEMWIDDVIIREYGLKLKDFEVKNAPETLGAGEEAQLTIGEFVVPTHAPTLVIYDVTNGTGSATIDQTGKLKGITAGTVTVSAASPAGDVVKNIPVIITNGTSLSQVNQEAVYLYPSVVKRGNTIQINGVNAKANVQIYNLNGVLAAEGKNVETMETASLSPGVYLVKINNESVTIIRKFIVQ